MFLPSPLRTLIITLSTLACLAALACAGKDKTAFADESAIKDFRWESAGDRLIFHLEFTHAPVVRESDDLAARRCYYLDFYHEPGPRQPAEWAVNSPLVNRVIRVYYPQQRVLRFIFYVPAGVEAQFFGAIPAQSGTAATHARLLTVMRRPAGVNGLPGAGKKLIVIDPGHGGVPDDPSASPGAQTSRRIGGDHYYEKDVVLSIGRYLAEYIQASPNMRCVMTRNEDRYVSLEDRIDFAHKSAGDLFISIHLNATDTRRKSARGFEIYYLSDEGTNKEVARAENEYGLHAGQTNTQSEQEVLQAILRSLADDQSRQRQQESRDLCSAISQEIDMHGPFVGENRGVKSAAFRVLLNYKMPAALAECGFLDNPSEAAELVQPGVQRQIAALLFNGINRYFAKVDPAFKPQSVAVGP